MSRIRNPNPKPRLVLIPVFLKGTNSRLYVRALVPYEQMGNKRVEQKEKLENQALNKITNLIVKPKN